MKLKNFISLFLCFICGIAVADLIELEKKADTISSEAAAIKNKAAKERKLEEAAEIYWQAAAAGSPTAVDKLSLFYNQWKKSASYNWGSAYRYLQAAADAEYNRLSNKPHRYDGRIFIIATEDAIIKRLGVDVIGKKYFWGGKKRCSVALKNLYRNFYININGKQIRVRSQYLGKELGNVVLLDRATAEKNFNFVIPPTIDWVTVVASPTDNKTLIPFEIFHRYVYESKMSEFMKICNELGAKEACVSYYQKNQTGIKGGVDVSVDGPAVQTYAGAKAQADVAVRQGNQENVEACMKFSGGKFIGKPKSPWFASEPTWEAMKKARLNRTNPLTEYIANFSYNDSFQVNVETKAALEKAGFKIGVNTKTEFEEFKSINWTFKVTFNPPGIFGPLHKPF